MKRIIKNNKNKCFLMFSILCIMSFTTFIQAQTLEDIVGTVPTENNTVNELKDVYGIDTLPNARSFVSGISATANGADVTIKWTGIVDPNLVYFVYRYTSPIIDEGLINKAKMVASISASESLSTEYSINDIPDQAGNYYYAVVSELNNIASFYTATPGMDMTTAPVSIGKVNNQYVASPTNNNNDTASVSGTYVTALRAVPQSMTNIMVYWQEIPGYRGEYIVYRSNMPITNSSGLSNAISIGRTIDIFFNDTTVGGESSLYYYVTTENDRNSAFIMNENYTAVERANMNFTNNMSAGYQVNNLDAMSDGSNVFLEWSLNSIPPENYKYIIVSTTNNFKVGDNPFNNDGIIGIKRVDQKSIISGDSNYFTYMDTPLATLHNYKPIYYALILSGDGNVSVTDIKEGMFTRYPVIISQMDNNGIANIVNTNVFPQVVTNTVVITNTVTNTVTNYVTNAVIDTANSSIVITNIITEEQVQTNIMSTNVKPKDTPAYKAPALSARESYEKAVIMFRDRKYKEVTVLLAPLSKDIKDKKLYYDINLLLGRSYQKLGQKKKALDTFRSIYNYAPSEVNFWISQVLSDL